MKKIIALLFLSSIILYAQIVGRQDVIGYTTYDWQYSGPVYSHCRVNPVAYYGLHCYWMYSNFNPATDRNQRYNFYDFSTRTWHWVYGINVYSIKSGCGGMDYNPITGCAVTSTHQSSGTVTQPVIARDITPGAGLFEYSSGPPGYRWPAIAVTNNEAIHIAMIDSTSQYNLYYLRVSPWGTSSTPMQILPSPRYPSHNIAASKTSNKVIILWVEMKPDTAYHNAYYTTSNDGGISWGPTVQLPFPPAFSGIPNATPSFNLASLFACFDNNDNFHIVASVNVAYNDSFAGLTSAEIWHYCPINNPAWSFIFRYNPYWHPQYPGYNAIIADRPSIVQAQNTGNFYVAWEVFDTLNYEPLTILNRADIYLAELTNNGQTLSRIGRITTPNTTSKRFPCAGGVFADTLVVSYIIDSIAGFDIMMQGRSTRNPVICHFIPLHVGIEEGSMFQVSSFTLQVSPNPFTSQTTIYYSLPIAGKISLQFYDVSGRLVQTLVDEYRTPGNYSTTLNSKTLAPGVYFCLLRTPNNKSTDKIIKTK